MKKKWLLLLFPLFLVHYAVAQQTLKNIKYVSAASARWTAEINLTGDSLLLDKRKVNTIIDQQRYTVEGQETRGDDFIVYVKKAVQPAPIVKSAFPPPPDFGSFSFFVFSFSKDKEKLFLLRNAKAYHSVAEIKSANTIVNFDDKYFMTWYAEPTFKQFTQYPDLLAADKSTVQQVINDLENKVKQQGEKARNTHDTGDMYGAGKVQDILSQVLITHHLNPLASISDLNQKTQEYHISIPPVR